MSIYIDLASPFHLATPSASWLAPIEAYDPLLRIFPSQTQAVYRLMRLAHRSGGLDPKVFGGAEMPADTRIAVQHKLVAVTTIPAGALQAPPENVVQWLKEHDITAFGGADKVADMMDLRDAAREKKIDDDHHDEGRQRHKASRTSYQYRTGARVSLVRPVVRRGAERPSLEPGSAETTGGSAATVSSLQE